MCRQTAACESGTGSWLRLEHQALTITASGYKCNYTAVVDWSGNPRHRWHASPRSHEGIAVPVLRAARLLPSDVFLMIILA